MVRSGGFGDAPDHDAPGSSGEVLEHDQGHAAQSHAEVEEVGEQIGTEELVGREQRADDAGDQRHASDNERALLHAMQSASEWSGDGEILSAHSGGFFASGGLGAALVRSWR